MDNNYLRDVGEREWEIIFDAIHDWVCLINLDSTITRSNIAGRKLFRLPIAEIIGQKCCKLVHGTDAPLEQCPLPQMIESGERQSIEIKSKDGRWVMITLYPIFDDNGKIVRAVHILRDITARITLQLEREQLIFDLQKANAKVDTLNGIIPICSICKKIRDNKGYWNQFEKFMKQRANVDFSHGICPGCAKEQYPELDLYDG